MLGKRQKLQTEVSDDEQLSPYKDEEQVLKAESQASVNIVDQKNRYTKEHGTLSSIDKTKEETQQQPRSSFGPGVDFAKKASDPNIGDAKTSTYSKTPLPEKLETKKQNSNKNIPDQMRNDALGSKLKPHNATEPASKNASQVQFF